MSIEINFLGDGGHLCYYYAITEFPVVPGLRTTSSFTVVKKSKEKASKARSQDRIHARCPTVSEHAGVQTCRGNFKLHSGRADSPASTAKAAQ